ncbi:MAG: PD40 domain-containing protein [Candidatus Cloacimonetes bacterium]|nr:PD40 domain-containing protein [Candidatus Cloacimonadota bacterium]
MKFSNIYFILLVIMICSCEVDNEYIPVYQDAIYIMDANGSNKQKVIEVDGCCNVQFIPDSDKLLYMLNRTDGSNMGSLYTVNTDGSEITQISSELKIRRDLPSISDDGIKIVFWVFDDSRDYAIYDLYMVDPMGIEITNLTQTDNMSEIDATFIQYQDQEYLLYVTYFTENEINYSTINMMNTTTFEIDTLYVEEIEGDHGFRKTIYDNVNDILFTIFNYYSVLEYSSLENGESIFVSDCLLRTMSLSIMYNQLLFNSISIMKYDYSLNQTNELVDGYRYQVFQDKVIYCTYSHSNDGDIYSIKLDGSNNTFLSEDGFYPRFSKDGSRIVYIGRYVTNPKRNLITN